MRCAQLFLALPDVDHAPLQRLIDVCARQLDTGDAGTERTEQALLRGSGWAGGIRFGGLPLSQFRVFFGFHMIA